MQKRRAAFKGHLRHICYYTAVHIPSLGKTILKKEKIPQNQLMIHRLLGSFSASHHLMMPYLAISQTFYCELGSSRKPKSPD